MGNLFCQLLLVFGPQQKHTSPSLYLSQYRLDEYPTTEADLHLQGIWKLQEDTNYNNYFVVERDGAYHLNITYMNQGGDNRGLEHADAFFSEVDGVTFLNAPYSSFFSDDEFNGTLLLRVDEISKPRSWKATVTMVVDTNIHNMKSSAELRAYVKGHMRSPGFYGKQIHFRKRFEFDSFR